ncbi:unnamed protein product [Parascedosporium putredinis]|uniref:Uncharacterized protein n=1 Tax=Parascedosporium putredinis TaxID=1442378 RepID=A0A9P1ME86_9PEZI|nr:unnamed protein product [Parascedosporium putredinis]CAI8001108.1 unnamed protein product [Parascedosporium putredinis]
MSPTKSSESPRAQKWQKIAADLSPAVKIGSESSTGSESIGHEIESLVPRHASKGDLPTTVGWLEAREDYTSALCGEKTISSDGAGSTAQFPAERNEVLESAKQSLGKSSPETAKVMTQIQDMPPRARDKKVEVGGGIQARVKMAWPWIQRSHGTVKVFDTHAAALASLQYEIHNVNDLAFFNADSQTYFLQPPCFPIDKEDDEVGRSPAEILMSVELRPARPYITMNFDEEEDYVIVDFRDDRIPECPLARGGIDNLDEFMSAEEY